MPFVVYSLLRLAIFVGALGVLAYAGMRGWLLVIVAALAAFFISYLALRRPRERAAVYLADRAEQRKSSGERFSREIEDDAAREDAAADAVRASDEGTALEREAKSEQDPESELEHPGAGEHTDESGTRRPGEDR